MGLFGSPSPPSVKPGSGDMKLTIELEGQDKLMQELYLLGSDIGGAGAIAVMTKAALLVQNQWKTNIYRWLWTNAFGLPKSDLVLTGQYGQSITIQLVKGSQQGTIEVVIGTDIGVPGGRATDPYPYWLEYGTVKMTPKPVMRAAVAETRTAVQKAIEDGINRLVARYGDKL